MKYINPPKLEGMQRRRPIEDCTGQKHGRLTVVEFVARHHAGDHKWRFLCECGREVVASIRMVKTGHTKSCGCLLNEVLLKRNTKHGLSKIHPQEYKTWKDMRSRCNNKNDSDYANYGGRGIFVCERWDSFASFFDDMGSKPEGMTIDRIDVNGGYEASNCRWATATTQANNKRNNRKLSNGRNITELCRDAGIDRKKVDYRLSVGYSEDDAFRDVDYRKCK